MGKNHKLVIGIQFWTSAYMIEYLKMDQKYVSVAYSVISISAPISGVLFGGFFTEKFGGYEDPKVRLYSPILSTLVKF